MQNEQIPPATPPQIPDAPELQQPPPPPVHPTPRPAQVHRRRNDMPIWMVVLVILAVATVAWFGHGWWNKPASSSGGAPAPTNNVGSATNGTNAVTAAAAASNTTTTVSNITQAVMQPMVITQVVHQVMQTIVTQVVKEVVHKTTVVTNCVPVQSPEYNFTQWVEHKVGTEVGTITNRDGQVVQTVAVVDREIISGGGTGPIQTFRSVVPVTAAVQPQSAIAPTPATVPGVTRPAQQPASKSSSGQKSYYIDPYRDQGGFKDPDLVPRVYAAPGRQQTLTILPANNP